MTDIVENNDANLDAAEDQGWEDALTNQYGEDKGGDDANKGTASTDNNAAGTGNAGDAGKKTGDDEDAAANAKTGDDEDEDAANKTAEYDPTIAVARRTQAQIREDHQAYVTDVREKLYPDLKTELQDSEGKSISSPRDLMRLENPQTGKAFTEEEASLFFIQAQQHLAKQNEAAQARIDQVADVLITVKDESLAVKQKWGPLLKELDKAQPGFSDNLLARFKKNLDVDGDSGLIVGFKMGPEEFYDTVLAGYEMAAKALRTGDEKVQETTQELNQTKTKLEKARTKADRSDITSSNNTDTRDDEDKGWDEAINTQFPDYNKKRK